jgi:hypothetical protein
VREVGGPAWLTGTLAAVMIATAVYCVSRLVSARRWRRPTEYDVDGVHVVMGVAMAGMLVPRLNVFWDSGWEVIFGAAMVWFGGRAIRGYRHRRLARRPVARPHRAAHDLQHLLASGAMLYMLAAASARTAGSGAGMSMAGPTGSRFPTLALVLALGLFGYVIWTTDKLASLAPVAALRAATAPAATALAAAAPPPAIAADGTAVPAAGRSPGPPDSPAAAATSAAGRGRVMPPLSPRLAACCEIVMGVTMGYALITML